jgi:hypothetical protein
MPLPLCAAGVVSRLPIRWAVVVGELVHLGEGMGKNER